MVWRLPLGLSAEECIHGVEGEGGVTLVVGCGGIEMGAFSHFLGMTEKLGATSRFHVNSCFEMKLALMPWMPTFFLSAKLPVFLRYIALLENRDVQRGSES